MKQILRLLVTLAILAAAWRVGHQLIAIETAEAFPDTDGLGLAIEWDPSNPQLYAQRAQFAQLELETAESEEVRADLLSAVRLNPHNWMYWRALGSHYELSGQVADAEEAYLKTLQLNPGNAYYLWLLGNFYIRQGRLEESIPLVERAIRLRVDYRLPAANLFLTSGATVEQFEKIWPTDTATLVSLLRFGVSRADRIEAQWGADFLESVFSRILSNPDAEVLGMNAISFYFRHLLARGDYQKLRRQWAVWMDSAGLGMVEFTSESNHVWNGDFSQPLAEGLLAWRVSALDGFSATREADQNENPTLVISFDGTENISREILSQLVIVKPGLSYQFGVKARSEALTTDQGPYFEIRDPEGGEVISTSPILGTSDWTEYKTAVVPGSASEVLWVYLKRNPSRRIDNRIEGKLWIDDVVIEEVAAEAEN